MGTFFVLDLSVGVEIRFIADKKLDYVFIAILVDLGEPVFDILEGLPFGDVIDQDDSVGSFVVGGSDGFESFLSGGVPDLELDSAAVGLEGSDLEINTNGWKETNSKQS